LQIRGIMEHPEWKQFETAVASFIAALDSSAVVTHDVMLPDLDTGKLRQRDVWIETKVCDHFHLKILVSCKRYKNKLNQQHIDAFVGELLSSGAQKGVIYSYSGFTKPALDKARVKGISCCRLYTNEVLDLPELLLFDAYLLTPAAHFYAVRLKSAEGQPETIGDLLNLELPLPGNNAKILLLDLLEGKYYKQRNVLREVARSTGEIPSDWSNCIAISEPQTGADLIKIEFGGCWDVYQARLEGYVVNGSYEFTENEFKGTQNSPEISKQGPDPGTGWKKIETIPEDLDKTALIKVLYSQGNYREVLQSYRDLKISELSAEVKARLSL